MNEHLSTLKGAVSLLRPDESDERREIYDRARHLLHRRLNGSSLSDAQIDAEHSALETAIQTVEADAVLRAQPRPQPAQSADRPMVGHANGHARKRGHSTFHLAISGVGAAVILVVLILGYSR